MTVRDLINGSLRLLGVLAQGEAIDASAAQDALDSFNSMLDSWSTESLSVMGMNEQNITLATAQQTYTMGTGGDIDIPRPVRIQDVAVSYPNAPQSVYIPLDEYTLDQYASQPVIGYQTPIPQAFYMNYSFPLNELNFYPQPQAGTMLRFWTWDVLSSIGSINQSLNLSPGYERAVRYNLAIELAPEYGKEPSSVVVARADEAKANIQRLNAQDLVLACDAAYSGWRGGGRFNWITGQVA